jgi:hypothetical protein
VGDDVSWMSDRGASGPLIAGLAGHKKTSTTLTVYRHQVRPVITKGAEILDEAFGKDFLKAGRARSAAERRDHGLAQ